jgi:hypothetical protein
LASGFPALRIQAFLASGMGAVGPIEQKGGRLE